MKIFISWSGTTSHNVAKVLRDWIPSVIQIVQPYVSSEDIDKGARWSTDIAAELQASSYGIICLTKDNVDAPWINFEAGALGKSIDKSRVSPFLFNLKRSEVSGPILQFQSTIVEKEDVFKLLESINNSCEKECLDDIRLAKTFEVWWPRLEAELQKINGSIPEGKNKTKELSNEHFSAKVLEELLELTRNNHKILRDPTSLLPPDYLAAIFRRYPYTQRTETQRTEFVLPSKVIAELIYCAENTENCLKALAEELSTPNRYLIAAIESLEHMKKPIRFITKKAELMDSKRGRGIGAVGI